MLAFEITAPRYSTIVVGESRKSCPLFDHEELEKDLPASLAFDAEGRIVIYSTASPSGALLANCMATRVSLPPWARAMRDTKEEES